MNEIFRSSLSETERDFQILESAFDTEIKQCGVMLEMTLSTYEINKAQAEHKVLTESGTYDDLEMLYTEANVEANQKGQGIFSKMIAAIRRFFGNICEKIQGLFGKLKVSDKDKAEKMEVSGDIGKAPGFINGLITKAKGLVTKIKNGKEVSDAEIDEIESSSKKVLKGAGITVTVGAAIVGIKKFMDSRKSVDNQLTELEQWASKFDAEAKIVKGAAAKRDKINKDEQNKLNKLNGTSDVKKLARLKQVIVKLSTAFKSVGSLVQESVSKIKSKISKKGTEAVNPDKDGTAGAEDEEGKDEIDTNSFKEAFGVDWSTFTEFENPSNEPSSDSEGMADIQQLLSVW